MQVKLFLFMQDKRRKEFSLTRPDNVIGRRQDCHLQVPLEGVSRQHCEVIVGDKGVKVKDLASSNGTYVNGKRVTESALNAGDVLAVGPVLFVVQIDGRPAEITPAMLKPAKAASKSRSAEEDADAILLGEEDEDQEFDPISALQALAEEGDEDEQ